jgi:hypothetical protein
VVLSEAFTLRVLQMAFLGDSTKSAEDTLRDGVPLTPTVSRRVEEDTGTQSEAMEPITLAEKAGAVLLLATSLWAGLYPRLLMEWIEAALSSPAFAGLRSNMGWP